MNNFDEKEKYDQDDQFSQENATLENNSDSPFDNSFTNHDLDINKNRDKFDEEGNLYKDNEVIDEDEEDDFDEEEEDDDDELDEDSEDDLDDDDDFQEEDLNDADGDLNDTNPRNPSQF